MVRGVVRTSMMTGRYSTDVQLTQEILHKEGMDLPEGYHKMSAFGINIILYARKAIENEATVPWLH